MHFYYEHYLTHVCAKYPPVQHPVVVVSFHSKVVFVAAFAFHYGIFGYILRRVCCRFYSYLHCFCC